jgi:drug/metabolite transporter (DMT)-like permease
VPTDPAPPAAPAAGGPPSAGARGLDLAALLALYVIWGSTYLAIRLAIDGIPPLLMAGSRFVLAGGALYAALRLRGVPDPGGTGWRAGALVGLFLCAANGLVTVAEQWVSSSVAAVVVSSLPLWTVLAAGLWREWPSRAEVGGILLGLAGVLLLQSGGELRAAPLGAFLLVAATWCWALGSMWSRRLPMPQGLMASATEMLAGGAALLLAGALRGERLVAAPGAPAVAAWLYLTVFGSLVAFSAYNHLLRRVRPALATSYAYVNPAVAVALGAAVGEPVGWRAVAALALILGGVGVVAGAKR